jgi:hypothetical protein
MCWAFIIFGTKIVKSIQNKPLNEKIAFHSNRINFTQFFVARERKKRVFAVCV